MKTPSVISLCLAWLGSSLALEAARPNILFLIVDDLRPELGCYDAPAVKTPHIDRFSETALVFDRAYCQQAVCMASRMSLLSGLRPGERKIWTNRDVRSDLRDIDLFPGHFRKHGYATVGIGKINHNSREDPRCWSEPHRMPRHTPFEYRTRAGRALVERMQLEAKEAGRPDPFRNIPEKIRRGMPWESLEVADSDLGDGQIADLAVESLDRLAAGKQPFLLAVGFLRPHLPFVAPKRYWDLYDPEELPTPESMKLPAGTDRIADNRSGELLRQYRGLPKTLPLDPDLARKLVHGYYACVSYIDAQIGRVLDALEARGLAGNTLVVLTSDHGFHLGDHGMWCKATNFEWATRVPLIVRVPGKTAAAGRRTRAVAELLDLYPTFCELAGLPRPKWVQGKSFVPLFDDPGKPHKPAAASQYYRGDAMGYSIRTANHRYTEWRDQKSGGLLHRELYDHRSHSREDRNLAGQPDFAQISQRLGKQLGEIFDFK